MMDPHTPGPWTAKRDRRRAAPWHIEGDGGIVAEVLAQGSFGTALPEETEANARLIAAAPEMLVALREALLQIDDGPSDCAGTRQDGTRVWKGSFLRRIEAMRAVIVKAEPDPA